MSANARASVWQSPGSRQGGPCRTASGACKTCRNQNAGTEHRCSQRGPKLDSRLRREPWRVQAAAEARMVRNTWQLEASDLLGKMQRASREHRARRCRPEVLSAHLRKAWVCRAMRLPSLPRKGLTGRRHARLRVSLARFKESPGTYPGQQPKRRAGEKETASWQEEDAGRASKDLEGALRQRPPAWWPTCLNS